MVTTALLLAEVTLSQLFSQGVWPSATPPHPHPCLDRPLGKQRKQAPPQHIRRLRGRHLYSLVAFPMVPWIVLLRQKGSLCRLPWNGRSFGWQWELVAGDRVGS